MLDQSFWDYIRQLQPPGQEEQLGPLAPFQAPPGTSFQPPQAVPWMRPPNGDMQAPAFDPNAWYKRPVNPEDTSPYAAPPSQWQGASMGGGFPFNPMRLGAAGDTGGGGLPTQGLLGGALGMSKGSSSKYGPMLMALGGGIAGGANHGWGAGIGQGLQGAALARMRGDENAQEQAYRDQLLKIKQAELAKGDPGTDDMREFEFAKSQGFQGGFSDWMMQTRKAGASTVQVGDPKFGTVPPGMMLEMDENGKPRLTPIPNPTADVAAQKAAEAAASNTAEKSDVILDAVDGIRKAQGEAILPTEGMWSRAPAQWSDTSAGEVAGHVKTLQSGVALEKIKEMKAQSQTGATGFGALNREELELLISDLGALDPGGNPAVFNQTVDRIEQRWNRVKADAKKNISPERWKELGLDEVFGDKRGGSAGGGGDLNSAIDAELARRKARK
jgi:hypothetical protein